MMNHVLMIYWCSIERRGKRTLLHHEEMTGQEIYEHCLKSLRVDTLMGCEEESYHSQKDSPSTPQKFERNSRSSNWNPGRRNDGSRSNSWDSGKGGYRNRNNSRDGHSGDGQGRGQQYTPPPPPPPAQGLPPQPIYAPPAPQYPMAPYQVTPQPMYAPPPPMYAMAPQPVMSLPHQQVRQVEEQPYQEASPPTMTYAQAVTQQVPPATSSSSSNVQNPSASHRQGNGKWRGQGRKGV